MPRVLALRGAAAFSATRLARIAETARQAATDLKSLAAEHWYFVETDGEPDAAELARLGNLLGVPAHLPAEPLGTLILVTPRLGTISPWSSKATDIARNCGLDARRAHRARHRLPRITPSRGDARCAGRAAAARPHDRIGARRHRRRTAGTVPARHAAAAVARSISSAAGSAALVAANGELGLALSDDEIDYLVDNFTQARPQSDRRRTDDVRAGQLRALPPQDLQRRLDRSTASSRPMSLFGMIRDTHKAHPAGHGGRLLRQLLGHRRRRRSSASIRGAGRRLRATAERTDAHPDEGRDAQPPDRHLAVPGRGHRLRRRDPRRRRDRPRLQAQGRPVRLLGLQPATFPAIDAAVGSRTPTASPERIASRARRS